MNNTVEVVLLGTAQDAGLPQIRCQCHNCLSVDQGVISQQYAVSLAIIDRTTKQVWLIDCSPDIRAQYALLQKHFGFDQPFQLEGIFLTHIHMGHYIGLFQFAREAMNIQKLKIYGTDRLCEYFRSNQPWATYIEIGNFLLQPLEPGKELQLSEKIVLQSQLVPHRAEFSDTVGYFVRGPSKRIFYCPDVDSWDRDWLQVAGRSPIEIIESVDQAFVDATFYSADELPNRKLEEIPHPLVQQTLAKFRGLETKLVLIHLNHSNPLFDDQSEARQHCIRLGIQIGVQAGIYPI